MATSAFAFTGLVQPGSTVSQTVPADFDVATAYLLGQCCSFTYDQYNQGAGWSPDWSSLVVSGCTVSLATTSLANPQLLTISEAVGGATPGDAGDYAQLPAGFAVQLTLTPTASGTAETIVMIALRGTRTFEEWIRNVEAFPVKFEGDDGSLGTVHAGFFADYTVGTDGVTSTTPLGVTSGPRALGSLAAQIQAYVTQLDGSLPVYVTGHSLGAALTVLCALDLASNFPKFYASLAAYTLACPRVAVGLNGSGAEGFVVNEAMGKQEAFVQNYQQLVPNTYAIVHACDIVPILPPRATPLSSYTLACAEVTDHWTGVGAAATATLSSGGVGAIAVSGPMVGYQAAHLPNVVISGGQGSGAQATASVSLLGTVSSVAVTTAGSGYTTPPTVQIVPTGPSLLGNVVSFCAQTGDLGNNHSCANTYVPYLAQLAAGLSGS